MKQVEKAIQVLKKGGVVVYPTDTAYGFAVDATNPKAIARLYKLKGRGFDKPIHVIMPSIEWILKTVVVDTQSLKVMNKFWPGPLTIVLPLHGHHKNLKRISGPTGLGIRFPKNQIAMQLASGLDRPITATSANLSGYDNTYSIAEVKQQFAKSKQKPDFYLDGGKLKRIQPSTLVAIAKGSVKMLREGPITEKQIRKALKEPSRT